MNMPLVCALILGALLAGCGGRPSDPPLPRATPTLGVVPNANGRGFPAVAPWLSFYGSSARMGDLAKAARTFRIINLEADPDTGSFSPEQIAQLKAGGANRVISYMNVGAMESFRSYWKEAPAGFLSGKANTAAHLGPYSGYPDET